MEHKLTVILPDEIYQPLVEAASKQGRTPEEFAAERLARAVSPRLASSNAEAREAQARFERHFGAYDSDDPDFANNERIDADLAREYASTHDED